jgi:pimeloyl-ACP methyl ester carboxylesterase
MATYVLVHGGAHGGWCYGKLSPLLRAAGHDVVAPTLTGVGERAHLVSPAVDLDLHIADLLAVLQYEDLRDAIVVGHSYGGMVITGAADRARERIGQLVYLDGALPQDGESLASMNPIMMEPAYAAMRVVDGVELVLFPDPDADSYYGVTDPTDVAWMRTRLTPHPWKTFAQPLTLRDPVAVGAIPRTNINCTETLSRRPPERQARALDADNVWEIDTGHDLMITEPAQVAEMLLRLAAPRGN